MQVSRPQVAVDRRPLPLLRRPSRRRQRLRGLRQDGQDLRQAQGPGEPQEGDGLLRLDPDRRHARRLPAADRRAAEGDRAGAPGDRVRLRQPAAPRGRDGHARCSPTRCCRRCSTIQLTPVPRPPWTGRRPSAPHTAISSRRPERCDRRPWHCHVGEVCLLTPAAWRCSIFNDLAGFVRTPKRL